MKDKDTMALNIYEFRIAIELQIEINDLPVDQKEKYQLLLNSLTSKPKK